MTKSKKKKRAFSSYLVTIFSILIGVGAGCLIGSKINTPERLSLSLDQYILEFSVLLALLIAALFLQIIIHEGGHLLFGLLSGYQFCSFRIASFMWVKQNGRICFRRYSLAGTGGQCLMAPPEPVDGKIPVFLYNMGGALLNLITAGVSFVLMQVLPVSNKLYDLCLMLLLFGVIFALTNGIPIHTAMLDNDGYNALNLRKNAASNRALYVQLKINQLMVEAVRLKDMPQELILPPAEESMKDALTATLGVFYCNSLMDGMHFTQAKELMEHYLSMNMGMAGVHKAILSLDLMLCELLEGNKDRAACYRKDLKGFMKSMKKNPSVLRNQYAWALLGEGNEGDAKKIKDRFHKVTANYPYESEVASEQELMEYIYQVWAEKQA